MHGLIARRYNIPMVSVRDALYDIMLDDQVTKSLLGYTRSEMMQDFIHPTAMGEFCSAICLSCTPYDVPACSSRILPR